VTTIHSVSIKCALCGAETNANVLGSTNQFGYADLDTRPPEMARSTIEYWLMQCPSCGYCSPNISAAYDGLNDFLRTPLYVSQLANETLPIKCREFLCWSLIAEHVGKLAAAAWSAIHAAWVCDDALHDQAAIECRLRAIILINASISQEQRLFKKQEELAVLHADLLRRTNQYSEAIRIIDESLAVTQDIYIQKLLEYERLLSQKEDAQCYNSGGAIGELEEPKYTIIM
jgi:hypothetical protein